MKACTVMERRTEASHRTPDDAKVISEVGGR